jgi:hypothetical protein
MYVCKLYLVKNYKIALNSTTTAAGEKIGKDFDLFKF